MKLRNYVILSIVLLVSILVVPLYFAGLSGDIESYISIAYDFPHMKWSLFPVGYPMLLKIFNYFCNDYYYAVRLVNFFACAVILIFSYLKKFHFKETLILLCTKALLHQFFLSNSEILFLVCMYFLFYHFYNFFIINNGKKFLYISASIWMIIMFLTRYSGLYIYIGLAIFYLFYYYNNKDKISFLKNEYVYFLIISLLGILGYCLFNYANYGDFMGESYRGKSEVIIGNHDFYMSVLGLFHSFNPIYFLRPESTTWYVVIIHIVMLIINIAIIFLLIKFWKFSVDRSKDWFYIMLIFIGIFYAIVMFVSIFLQNIYPLDSRLLSETSFCVFYATIFLYFRAKMPEKFPYFFAIFALVSNSLYFMSVSNFDNSLKLKDEIKDFYTKNKGKKFYYDDEKNRIAPTVYEIPLVNKKFSYTHKGREKGKLYEIMFVLLDPKICVITKDTIRDKSKVIYASEVTNFRKLREKP